MKTVLFTIFFSLCCRTREHSQFSFFSSPFLWVRKLKYFEYSQLENGWLVELFSLNPGYLIIIYIVRQVLRLFYIKIKRQYFLLLSIYQLDQLHEKIQHFNVVVSSTQFKSVQKTLSFKWRYRTEIEMSRISLIESSVQTTEIVKSNWHNYIRLIVFNGWLFALDFC